MLAEFFMSWCMHHLFIPCHWWIPYLFTGLEFMEQTLSALGWSSLVRLVYWSVCTHTHTHTQNPKKHTHVPQHQKAEMWFSYVRVNVSRMCVCVCPYVFTTTLGLPGHSAFRSTTEFHPAVDLRWPHITPPLLVLIRLPTCQSAFCYRLKRLCRIGGRKCIYSLFMPHFTAVEKCRII